ncbi:phosphoadenosine phosphosulfate reductase domain-containing protein [Archaeoglobus profundus]|uniref:Phosphoadenosine phosphosulfate reductase n=1 Tax=Archaeoglobus profundus (strain DSM 5631 / JCM 9629 / NBRC 100127 / Av18) TaxID=572546 RepID=D2RH85_ARCPA|nr:phosphoadenosine phosphosulfate reductase family protein [Archaeoglobus profundus]ADB57660.1 phosphoadenosine phosphosulfate reductase [Archaeoglobus profundus DSM 5631]
MIVAIARAKKDAKALKHALNCEVLSLGGIRSLESVDFSIFRDKIPIFFFGKDEVDLALEAERMIKEVTPIYQIVVLSKKAVRNTRMEEIREKFEMAKAKIRLGVKFDKVFVFSPKNEFGIEIHPDYDSYFIIGKGFIENMRKIGVDVEEGNLILRKLYNEENVYVPELKAIVSKRIGEKVRVNYLSDVEPKKMPIDKTIEKNRMFLEVMERISIKFIREHANNVAVPFSGGKDSLACLILAKKALGDVKAIYIKTNYEMPYTEEYIERVCKRLGVDLIVESVKFDVEKYGMPTHQNRWCTKLKMEALERVVKSEEVKTLIVGDRDAESRVRRERPVVFERIAKEIFPIKYWSGAMVQLYILMNGLDLHPLYYKGFYRLGCTICPSLSEWEKNLLES